MLEKCLQIEDLIQTGPKKKTQREGVCKAVRKPFECRPDGLRPSGRAQSPLQTGFPEHSFLPRLQGRLNAVRSPSGRPKGRPDGDPENEEYSWYLGLFLCMTIYTLLCVSGGCNVQI